MIASVVARCLLLLSLLAPAWAAQPERVVTLAPHLAEIVFAAGAGERLAGVTAYTDYPPEAAALPKIGDAFRIDMERLSVIDPDLVLAWAEGTPMALQDRLRSLGYEVVPIRTRNLEEVASAMEWIGDRLGTGIAARAAAEAFRSAIADAVTGYGDRRPLRVFYQVSARPLYTVNGGHIISELIRLCGGRNIFADLGDLAPVVSVEGVLARDPELILAAGQGREPLQQWERWPSLTAVRAGNLFVLAPDTLSRPSPRLATGAADVCRAIDAARATITVPPEHAD